MSYRVSWLGLSSLGIALLGFYFVLRLAYRLDR